MTPEKLIHIPQAVTPANFADAMQQAIALELATIPTYLSTYYSINRAQDQDKLYAHLLKQLLADGSRSAAEAAALAQELKVDILVYANQTAALIMSVVIEEMLHLALACNVKQALAGPPDLLGINKDLVFPTKLDGHDPEFPIDAAKLDLRQLTTFLKIESPRAFENPPLLLAKVPIDDYKTIGDLYTIIQDAIRQYYPNPAQYANRPQLLPPTKGGPQRPYYSQNSVNTVYFDRSHNPVFTSGGGSGELMGVHDADSAVAALEEIKHQGEGSVSEGVPQTVLTFGPDGLPVPMPVKDGKVTFKCGDTDSESGELSHFAKFMEAYSLGRHYEDKFARIPGLADFFSYFVYDQAANPRQADYDASGNAALALCSKLGNATFTYILLMIEACYYADEHTQFRVFMYGIHKSMIWLLSGVGGNIRAYDYKAPDGQKRLGALTWEYYDFTASTASPKQQIIELTKQLAAADDKGWGWMTKPEYDNYWPALPDVSLDHRVTPNVPAIPA